MKIITISGKAKAGKDLSAEIIASKLPNVLIIHYADYLKFACQKYFGWNGAKDEIGRSILQYIGTEKIRTIDPDFHADLVMRLLKVFENDYDYVIIPDARFPNEIEKLKSKGFDAVSLHVERLDYENNLTPEQRMHASEIALDEFPFDYYLKSCSGKQFLAKEIDNFIAFLGDLSLESEDEPCEK